VASSPMLCLWQSRWRMPHAIDKKYGRKGNDRYGLPRFAFYFADERFEEPGVYLWVGLTKKNGPLRRNYRILKAAK
jgi:hypothetical protein